jgi:hypothetical protein
MTWSLLRTSLQRESLLRLPARPPPKINICNNVVNIPKAKTTHTLTKLPRHLQQCRRGFHIEVATCDIERLKELVRYGKKKGFFKEYLNPHCHPSEITTWESSANDMKRAEKMLKDMVNYNASMTSTDI